MGYAATSIALLGFPLTEEQAEQIYDLYFQNNDKLFNNAAGSPVIFHRRIDARCRYAQKMPVTPYLAHSSGESDPLFFGTMLSDGTDSRAENLSYEPGYEHFLGIFIGSKGYGYHDQISVFIQNLPQEAIDNYYAIISPICTALNIHDEPQVHIINQTW